jgi:hypothetical protein
MRSAIVEFVDSLGSWTDSGGEEGSVSTMVCANAAFGVLWITVDQAHELRKTTAQAPARRCSKKWSGRWRTGCGRARRWGAGATMSFWFCRTSARRRCWRPCAGAGRTGQDGGLPLVGRPDVAHREHRRGPGGTGRNFGATAGKSKAAMFSSFHAGGNRITAAPGGQACCHHRHCVVFGAVIGGFLMEKGHHGSLAAGRAADLAGAATGTLLVANPMHIIKGIIGAD